MKNIVQKHFKCVVALIKAKMTTVEIGNCIGYGPIAVTKMSGFPFTVKVCVYETKNAKNKYFSNRFDFEPVISETYDYVNWETDFWEKHSDLITKEYTKWVNKFGA